ncbi:dihydrofolate reductase family protein [Cellulomonas endophytica]|uniref:dihydrofolate reductase family protein n=1 Tax=Cellulomonas endophytica TaxID=2494735 RepID=UPI0013E92BAA|nr:dihydrofolate reductase family protein [Cellulomonas endophytica]
MGRLVVVEQVTLDGVAQSPGRPDEDARDGFDRGGWAMTWFAGDPEGAGAAMRGSGGTAAFLFGRRTYLDLVGYWLGTSDPNPFADILRGTPKHVVTSTLAEPLPHPASHRVDGADLVGGVRAVKEQVEGDIVVLGSIQLVHALAAADLVDAYLLTTVPLLVGPGLRLFDGPPPARLAVSDAFVSPAGSVTATYTVERG